MLDSYSTDRVSIEIFEIQFFRADFTPIHEYMFELSFLTTLNIYMECFKGCHNWCNLMQKKISQAYCESETYALIHLSIQEAAMFVHCTVL